MFHNFGPSKLSTKCEWEAELKVAGKLSISFLDVLLVSLPMQVIWYFSDVAWCPESQAFLPTRITERCELIPSFIYSSNKWLWNISIRYCSRHIDTVGEKREHYPCSSGGQGQNETSDYNSINNKITINTAKEKGCNETEQPVCVEDQAQLSWRVRRINI